MWFSPANWPDPTEALMELDDLDLQVRQPPQIKATETQQKIRDILGRLYTDYENKEYTAPSLSDEDRTLLKSELGWAGRLALAPEGGSNPDERRALLDSARGTAKVEFGVIVIGIALAGLRTSRGISFSSGGVDWRPVVLRVPGFRLRGASGGVYARKPLPSGWRLFLPGLTSARWDMYSTMCPPFPGAGW